MITGDHPATARAIAERLGATVHRIDWPGDFAPARNQALQWVHGDWVLVLDDEAAGYIPPGSGQGPLEILTGSVPSGRAEAPYSIELLARGGTPPYVWSVATNSTLPAGLTLATNGPGFVDDVVRQLMRRFPQEALLDRVARQGLLTAAHVDDLARAMAAEPKLLIADEAMAGLSHHEVDDILALLIRQPGRVYSRHEIGQDIWQGRLPEGSNVVDVHMANLRAKLRDLDGYGVIRTVRGIGYALKTP